MKTQIKFLNENKDIWYDIEDKFSILKVIFIY